MKPGINEQNFEIKLENNWYKNFNIINTKIIDLHWFWKMLGFDVEYEAEVLNGSKQIDEFFTYEVKLHNKIYYWFNFKLKTVKL